MFSSSGCDSLIPGCSGQTDSVCTLLFFPLLSITWKTNVAETVIIVILVTSPALTERSGYKWHLYHCLQ